MGPHDAVCYTCHRSLDKNHFCVYCGVESYQPGTHTAACIEQTANAALYKGEALAQAVDLFRNVPNGIRVYLQIRLQHGVDIELITQRLPTLLTLLQVAIAEGWTSELLQRLAQEEI